jgi:ABC-type glycerol-3-phosphate transport system substrate-binding protein
MIDNPWFPHLVKNDYLVELSDYIENEEEDFKTGFIPKVFDNYSRYRDGYYALPFHFEVQLLFYRKDLFNDEGIKRNFFRKYGVELSVPKSWDEYNTIAEFFTKRYNIESPILFGNTATAATTTICDYLPRLWAYGGSIFNETGETALQTYEAIEALKCYIKSFQFAHRRSVNYWYWDEVEEFAKGNAAMMIMFIAHTSRLIDLEYSNVAGKFDVCELPGGHPVLSGWSLGIHKNSPSKEVAYEFMKWSSSSKIAIPYTILGGCTPRSSLNQTEELLNLYPYFNFAEEQFQKSRKRTYPFDELIHLSLTDREFEIIVHRNIRKAVSGTLSPEAALRNADEEIQKHKRAG